MPATTITILENLAQMMGTTEGEPMQIAVLLPGAQLSGMIHAWVQEMDNGPPREVFNIMLADGRTIFCIPYDAVTVCTSPSEYEGTFGDDPPKESDNGTGAHQPP